MGIHAGPVIGGVIGYKLPRFRLFGDTVNTSARMQTHSMPGEICMSQSAADLIAAAVQVEASSLERLAAPADASNHDDSAVAGSSGAGSGGSGAFEPGGSGRRRRLARGPFQHLVIVDRGFKEVKSKGLVKLFFLREKSRRSAADRVRLFWYLPRAFPLICGRVYF